MLDALCRINRLSLWTRGLKVWGNCVTAPTLDRLVYLQLHRVGLMGSAEKSFLESQISPGMNVVDIGANLGLYTLFIARLVQEGSVFAFEPDPELFAILKRNCECNQIGNVRVHNVALGRETGSRPLFRSKLNSGDNRLTKGDYDRWFEEMAVRITTLDATLPGVRIDWIKIDVQGWEYEVIRGMDGVLSANPRAKIYFEFWPFGLRRAGCAPSTLLEHLTQRSYMLSEPTRSGSSQVRDIREFCARFRGYSFTNLLAEPLRG